MLLRGLRQSRDQYFVLICFISSFFSPIHFNSSPCAQFFLLFSGAFFTLSQFIFSPDCQTGPSNYHPQKSGCFIQTTEGLWFHFGWEQLCHSVTVCSHFMLLSDHWALVLSVVDLRMEFTQFTHVCPGPFQLLWFPLSSYSLSFSLRHTDCISQQRPGCLAPDII